MFPKKFISAVTFAAALTLLVTPSASALDLSAPHDAGARSVRIDGAGSETTPQWVMPGAHTQYPNEGGKWEYGFWNLKFRSYYTVGRCHGSTVKDGGRESRSAETQPGKKSVAELWAINNPWADPHYYYRVC